MVHKVFSGSWLSGRIVWYKRVFHSEKEFQGFFFATHYRTKIYKESFNEVFVFFPYIIFFSLLFLFFVFFEAGEGGGT